MLSSKQKRTSPPHSNSLEKGIATVLVAGTAFTLDQFIGARTTATRRTNPEFYTARPEGARHTLGVMPGCRQNPELLLERLKLALPMHNIVVARYQEKGFDEEALCSGFIQKLIEVGAQKPDMYFPSMAGIAMRHLFAFSEHTNATDRIGGYGNVKLDDSPFTWADVRESPHHWATIGAAAHNSFVGNFLGRLALPDDYDLCKDTPLAVTANQTNWMKHGNHPASVPDIYESMEYHFSSGRSPTVDHESAFPKYEAATNNRIVPVQDAWRPANQHTANPGEFVTATYLHAA